MPPRVRAVSTVMDNTDGGFVRRIRDDRQLHRKSHQRAALVLSVIGPYKSTIVSVRVDTLRTDTKSERTKMLQHISSEVVHSLSNNTSTGRKYPRRDQGS